MDLAVLIPTGKALPKFAFILVVIALLDSIPIGYGISYQ